MEHPALAAPTGSPLTLTHRFDADGVGELVDRYQPVLTVGSIAAFVALMDRMNPPTPTPVPAQVLQRWRPAAAATVQRYRAEHGA